MSLDKLMESINSGMTSRILSPKLLKSAKGRECTVRIPGICNRNPETVVAAHLPTEFKGMGNKSPDFCIAYACHSCHMVLDMHDKRCFDFTAYELREFHVAAMIRTWVIMIEEGLIKIPLQAKSVPSRGKVNNGPKKKWPSRKIPSRPFKRR